MTEPLPWGGKLRKAPLPKNEAERLRVLQLYRILDTPPEDVFDEITHLAAQICECPIAAISFIDEAREWHKSRVGIGISESPRDIAASPGALLQNRPLLIDDTREITPGDDTPAFAKDPGARFYAGLPLTTESGFVLGVLGVVDRKPRHLAPTQVQALETLSRQIVTHLELRRALLERSMAEAEILRLNQVLERRVDERTSQLNSAYESLKAEIEDRERLQHQMLQIQKIEAVGRLAGGIAHDFNNILLVINGYSDMLITQADPKDSNLDFLKEIQRAGKRGASLTRQLLTFSRRQVIEPKVFDLNETVDGMGGMLNRLIGPTIKFEVRKGGIPRYARADVSQIEQVIMNLVINACDAMPDGGTLEVETSTLVLNEPLLFDGGEIKPNHYSVLTVRDTGTGMTPEVKARMFDPFFTTKPEGKGTGLGLATCFAIVEQTGGYITCDTEVGQGTAFRVLLPAPELQSVHPVASPVSTPVLRGQERILLVEDDDAVRKLATLMLESLGYEVLEAEDGEVALALAQARSELRIDLLISDLNMPNLNGHELAERLFRLRPEIKCLLMSGHTDDGLIHRGAADQATLFLQKPFTPDQLSVRVREVLDQDAVA